MAKQEMTVEEAARMLMNAARATAEYSQNWENYEGICKSVIQQALDAGREFGRKEAASE